MLKGNKIMENKQYQIDIQTHRQTNKPTSKKPINSQILFLKEPHSINTWLKKIGKKLEDVRKNISLEAGIIWPYNGSNIKFLTFGQFIEHIHLNNVLSKKVEFALQHTISKPNNIFKQIKYLVTYISKWNTKTKRWPFQSHWPYLSNV